MICSQKVQIIGKPADMLIAEFSLIFIAVVFSPRKNQTTKIAVKYSII